MNSTGLFCGRKTGADALHPEFSSPPGSNLLLASLLAPTPEAIGRDFELVPHCSPGSVSTRRRELGWVHFPVRGALSMLQTVDGVGGIEVALVGTRGMIGLPWQAHEASCREVSVIPHAGAKSLRIRADRLTSLLGETPGALEGMICHLGESWLKLALNLACLRHHALDKRLARWITHMLDYYPGSEVKATQQVLAQLLGVRRGAISVAAGCLQRGGLVRYSRGVIRVGDRRALAQAACNCYQKHREIGIATTGIFVAGAKSVRVGENS